MYFPYTQEDKRLKKFHSELKELLYGSPEKGKSVGQLKSKDKPIIFRLEFGSTFSNGVFVYILSEYSAQHVMHGSGSSYGQHEENEEGKPMCKLARYAELHAVGFVFSSQLIKA